jgi:hypothetical protein
VQAMHGRRAFSLLFQDLKLDHSGYLGKSAFLQPLAHMLASRCVFFINAPCVGVGLLRLKLFAAQKDDV